MSKSSNFGIASATGQPFDGRDAWRFGTHFTIGLHFRHKGRTVRSRLSFMDSKYMAWLSLEVCKLAFWPGRLSAYQTFEAQVWRL
jgi:hypothetical protein